MSRAEPPFGSILLQVTYFTDPLCCWSWGFEPQLRRLRYAYAGRIAWRTRMGGLISDWEHFEDPLNAIHRPSQMGPMWLQAKHITGMPLEANIWVQDPPASSWPSCLAVKAAELQSGVAADLYLRRLREAVMVEGRNIARPEVLHGIADALGGVRPELFDPGRFRADLDGSEARRALQDDVKEARFRGIGRFPCLVLQSPAGAPKYLVGWRPYPALEEALTAAEPDLGPGRQPVSPEAYRAYWGDTMDREVAEVRDHQTSGGFEAPLGATSSGFEP